MIGKLKNDRENLINSLCDNIAALERIAFEQQTEIKRLQKEVCRFADIGKLYSEIRSEVIKEYLEKVKLRLVDKGFFPALVKSVMEKVAEEMEAEL